MAHSVFSDYEELVSVDDIIKLSGGFLHLRYTGDLWRSLQISASFTSALLNRHIAFLVPLKCNCVQQFGHFLQCRAVFGKLQNSLTECRCLIVVTVVQTPIFRNSVRYVAIQTFNQNQHLIWIPVTATVHNKSRICWVLCKFIGCVHTFLFYIWMLPWLVLMWSMQNELINNRKFISLAVSNWSVHLLVIY